MTNITKGFALLLALVTSSLPIAAQEKIQPAAAILRNQGFTGVLSGDVHLTTLGTLKCQSTKLRVFYYEWTESASPGLFPHASYRVVLIQGNSYLGSYSVADRPRATHGGAILFPYAARLGNEISCGSKGLPDTVLLDGETHTLGK